MSPPTNRRRSVTHRAQATQLWLVFGLRQDWFALPVHVVHKVVHIERLYGTGSDSMAGLAFYQNQEIPVIDLEPRIYGPCHQLLSGSGESSFRASDWPRLLLITTHPQGGLVGFPLSEPPTLRRLTDSAFSPLPATYLSEGSLKGVGAIAVPDPDQPPIFVLNLNQLFQPPDGAGVLPGKF